MNELNAMTTRQFLAHLKAAAAVFAWVNLTADEGAYLQVQKQSAREAVKHMLVSGWVNAEMRGDDLYIN